jgi:uroporphyrinogen III methyltransferase/synthase
MGVAHRAEIATRLIDAGLDPATPVVAVTWGTRPAQTTVRTHLAGLGTARLEPPATIVIGEVAGLDLGWFDRRPLFGRRVVVTRPPGQASRLCGLLAELGAVPVEVPAVRFTEPADGGAALQAAAGALTAGGFSWVVFTSARAVERFVPLLRDARAFGAARIAAIGPGTAAALAGRNLQADLVPPEFVAESLLEAFPSGLGRVLLPRAAVARDVLPAGLRAKGWAVEVVEAYRTEPARPDAATLAVAAGADAITFTSSSTVTGYLKAAGEAAVPPFVACIGPVTAETARAAGLRVDVVAGVHTVDGLVDALRATLGATGAGGR